MMLFGIGIIAGIALALLLLGFHMINKLPDVLEEDIDRETLVTELRTMRLVTGLSRREKKILTEAANYIERK